MPGHPLAMRKRQVAGPWDDEAPTDSPPLISTNTYTRDLSKLGRRRCLIPRRLALGAHGVPSRGYSQCQHGQIRRHRFALDDEDGGRIEHFAEQPGTQVGDPVDLVDRLLLKVEEAAVRLQIGRTTMYDLVRRGEVESVPIGRLRRIPADCLDEYVARLRSRAESEQGQPWHSAQTRIRPDVAGP
jgi:excisionase family DNA binding protein